MDVPFSVRGILGGTCPGYNSMGGLRLPANLEQLKGHKTAAGSPYGSSFNVQPGILRPGTRTIHGSPSLYESAKAGLNSIPMGGASADGLSAHGVSLLHVTTAPAQMASNCQGLVGTHPLDVVFDGALSGQLAMHHGRNSDEALASVNPLAAAAHLVAGRVSSPSTLASPLTAAILPSSSLVVSPSGDNCVVDQALLATSELDQQSRSDTSSSNHALVHNALLSDILIPVGGASKDGLTAQGINDATAVRDLPLRSDSLSGVLGPPVPTLKPSYSKMTTGSSLKLTYLPPEIRGDRLTAVPPLEVSLRGSKAWSHCLVGYVLDKKLPFTSIDFVAKMLWKKWGLLEVMASDSGFYFFKFRDDHGLEQVLGEGHWMFQGRPMFLRRWEPGMVLTKESQRSIPLWIKFLNIPLEFWNVEGLSHIVSTVGIPLQMDGPTTRMCNAGGGRLSYARVLVEVAASRCPPSSVDLISPSEDPSRQVTAEIMLEYQWCPTWCSHCKIFGHSSNSCLSKPKDLCSSVTLVKPVPLDGSIGSAISLPRPRTGARGEAWQQVVSRHRGKSQNTSALMPPVVAGPQQGSLPGRRAVHLNGSGVVIPGMQAGNISQNKFIALSDQLLPGEPQLTPELQITADAVEILSVNAAPVQRPGKEAIIDISPPVVGPVKEGNMKPGRPTILYGPATVSGQKKSEEQAVVASVLQTAEIPSGEKILLLQGPNGDRDRLPPLNPAVLDDSYGLPHGGHMVEGVVSLDSEVSLNSADMGVRLPGTPSKNRQGSSTLEKDSQNQGGKKGRHKYH